MIQLHGAVTSLPSPHFSLPPSTTQIHGAVTSSFAPSFLSASATHHLHGAVNTLSPLPSSVTLVTSSLPAGHLNRTQPPLSIDTNSTSQSLQAFRFSGAPFTLGPSPPSGGQSQRPAGGEAGRSPRLKVRFRPRPQSAGLRRSSEERLLVSSGNIASEKLLLL